MIKRGKTIRVRLLSLGLCALGLTYSSARLTAQETPNVPDSASTPTGPPVTARGVVLNSATGLPLPRALVTISGLEMGALTDGEGRFEIPDVPQGVQSFDVIKPGFQHERGIGEQIDPATRAPSIHVVRVTGDMPELTFSLAPRNAIYGHVTLSTGVPAMGIALTLVRQTIFDGRVGWTKGDRRQTTPDGAFRYSGLSDGTYLIMTNPEFDNDDAAEPTCSANTQKHMPGYAVEFYNGAPGMAGAARIVVAGGQSAEADLTLNLTEFHLVEVAPARAQVPAGWAFSNTLTDRSGQELDYPVHEEKDHSLCAYLPDGAYAWSLQSSGPSETEGQPSREPASKGLSGLLEFSVDSQPVTNLRTPLTQAVLTPVHLRYEPGQPKPVAKEKSPDGEEIELDPDTTPLSFLMTRAGSVVNQDSESLDSTSVSETVLRLESASPGAYWFHVAANRPGICASAVTAGGEDLARVPWIVGPSGAGTPIEMVLRTDCAKLTVQMPATFPAAQSGGGARWYIYAVPEFSSIDDVSQTQITQFDSRSATLQDMVPGPYRIFAFLSPRSIEFRNPAALDRLGTGQEVMLDPGADTTLVLEGASR